jgi:hypothetical protein
MYSYSVSNKLKIQTCSESQTVRKVWDQEICKILLTKQVMLYRMLCFHKFE